MFTLPDPLSTVTALVRRRLGDPIPITNEDAAAPAEPLWTTDEIEAHFRDGLEELCRVTGILWDKETLDDSPPACNYEFDFERRYVALHIRRFTPVIGTVALLTELHVLGYRYECNFQWEADGGSHSQFTLGEIEFPWERDYAAAGSLHQAAVVPLPDGALEVVRVTWDNKRIPPVRSSDLEHHDPNYETIPGVVRAYSQDKDGLSNLRKYQIPVAAASLLSPVGVVGIPRGVGILKPGAAVYHMHLDEWGMVFGGVLDAPLSIFGDFFQVPTQAAKDKDVTWLRSDSPFADCEVVGSEGGLRRLPGYHPARSTYGTARHIASTVRNTAVETHRSPLVCEQGFDRPQVPAFMVLYARHYTLWKCLSRKGAGQNMKLAAHYKLRWQQALTLTQERLTAIQSQVVHGFGPQGRTPTSPPLARPASDLDYGQMDRF